MTNQEFNLPKAPDGEYFDAIARIFGENEELMKKYEERIKKVYKVQAFELLTERHGTLKFHRGSAIISIDEIQEDKLKYLIYDENVEYLSFNLTGTILIDKKEKSFRIQIFYQDDIIPIERRGLATEIWKMAPKIMEIIGIDDYKDYTICTMVDEATMHLLNKYGNPFEGTKTTEFHNQHSLGSELEL